ncbi:MAG: HypC/HybG/HupF family hydrogenase formation chaperone [Betaproteobacteria bacterium]
MCLGIPGKVIEITDEETNLGIADVSGVKRTVNLTCVAGCGLQNLVGSWVLIHVGFGMAVIDEDEARETLRTLHELGDAQEELFAMLAGDQAVQGR